FNWQLFYFYDEPILLRGDDTLRVTCHFDTRGREEPVTPGWGTQNEMCLAGLFLVPRCGEYFSAPLRLAASCWLTTRQSRALFRTRAEAGERTESWWRAAEFAWHETCELRSPCLQRLLIRHLR